MIGVVLLPVGLFWFAWSTYPQVHWIVSILGGATFGFGQVLLYISLINYVVTASTVYVASALTVSAILLPPPCKFSSTPHGPISTGCANDRQFLVHFSPLHVPNPGKPMGFKHCCLTRLSMHSATPSGREASMQPRRKRSLRPCRTRLSSGKSLPIFETYLTLRYTKS